MGFLASCTGRSALPAVLAITMAGVGSVALAAEEEKPPSLSDTAEFSYVLTAGNSETNTLGFKNAFVRNWERASLTVRAGAVRTETTTTTRVAEGTPSDFRIVETSTTATTGNYFLNGQHDRKVTERFLWYIGAGWQRNRPAGIKSRYVATAGVGNVWVDRAKVKFKTDYGLTYTKENDLVRNPSISGSFLGARLAWDYWHKFGENTTYGSVLILDDNLDHASDYRADFTNWLAVSMNKRLALKVSLQWLYDNKPALRTLALVDATGAVIGTVLDEFDDLDTIFTASLVLNF